MGTPRISPAGEADPVTQTSCGHRRPARTCSSSGCRPPSVAAGATTAPFSARPERQVGAAWWSPRSRSAQPVVPLPGHRQAPVYQPASSRPPPELDHPSDGSGSTQLPTGRPPHRARLYGSQSQSWTPNRAGATLQVALQEPWCGCCKVLLCGTGDFGSAPPARTSQPARTGRYRFLVHVQSG